jgi:3-hydroxybutyryl-CoA dehydrogenase
VGLDVRLEVTEYLHKELGGERFAPPAILKDLVKEGRLGRKTGEGFYTYPAGG